MAKKLLLLNNSPRRELAGRPDERFRALGLHVDQRWAWQGDLPDSSEGYDGCFISGSPKSAYDDDTWIAGERALIGSFAERGVPMMGVCFGSQILAHCLCGPDQVFRRTSCEVGYVPLRLTADAKDDLLMRGLGPSVRMFVWHNDDIKGNHADMRVLADSAQSANHVWRYRSLPIWGIQGHPEVDKDEARSWFDCIRSMLEKDGADVDRLKAEADDTLDAKQILTRFAAVVAAS